MGKNLSYRSLCAAVCFLSIVFSILFSLNHPIMMGMVWCCGELFGFEQLVDVFYKIYERRLLSLSDRSVSGIPNIGTSSSAKSLTRWRDFWSGTGKISGHFVRKSWNTMTCWLPRSVVSRSMTSTPSIWKHTALKFDAVVFVVNGEFQLHTVLTVSAVVMDVWDGWCWMSNNKGIINYVTVIGNGPCGMNHAIHSGENRQCWND